MEKRVLVLFLLVCAGVGASAAQDQKEATTAPPAESKPVSDVAKTNPVKPTAESLAQAKKTYGFDCAMCHGASGDGQGDLATDMKLKLLDYRDAAALKDKTDDELFGVIQKGKGQMPAEGDRAKPEQIWNLVHYVRSFAKSAPSKEKTTAP